MRGCRMCCDCVALLHHRCTTAHPRTATHNAAGLHLEGAWCCYLRAQKCASGSEPECSEGERWRIWSRHAGQTLTRCGLATVSLVPKYAERCNCSDWPTRAAMVLRPSLFRATSKQRGHAEHTCNYHFPRRNDWGKFRKMPLVLIASRPWFRSHEGTRSGQKSACCKAGRA
jgi:hypothetical protein